MGSTQKNVNTTASHVGSNRHGAEAARFSDDTRFVFMELRIQNVVRNSVHQTFKKLIPLVLRQTQAVSKLRNQCRVGHFRYWDTNSFSHWFELAERKLIKLGDQ